MYDKEEYIFPRAFHRDIMESLLMSENEDASKVYIEEFAEQYDDIRYFTFSSVKYVIFTASGQQSRLTFYLGTLWRSIQTIMLHQNSLIDALRSCLL